MVCGAASLQDDNSPWQGQKRQRIVLEHMQWYHSGLCSVLDSQLLCLVSLAYLSWIKLTGEDKTGHFSRCWRMKIPSLYVLLPTPSIPGNPNSLTYPVHPPYPGHSLTLPQLSPTSPSTFSFPSPPTFIGQQPVFFNFAWAVYNAVRRKETLLDGLVHSCLVGIARLHIH